MKKRRLQDQKQQHLQQLQHLEKHQYLEEHQHLEVHHHHHHWQQQQPLSPIKEMIQSMITRRILILKLLMKNGSRTPGDVVSNVRLPGTLPSTTDFSRSVSSREDRELSLIRLEEMKARIKAMQNIAIIGTI